MPGIGRYVSEKLITYLLIHALKYVLFNLFSVNNRTSWKDALIILGK